MARIDLVDIRRVVFFASDLVVVTQLITRRDIARRIDEYPTMFDDGLTVAFTLVVDEARVVSADTGIDDRVLVDNEQEGVIVADVVVFVTRVGRLVRQALPEILENSRALPDGGDGKNAAAMYRRIAHLDERGRDDGRAALEWLRLVKAADLPGLRFPRRFAHTATGALIAG
jgi:hypothetical protein